MRVKLPDELLEACRQAIGYAKESERYLEKDGDLHPLVGAVILDKRGRKLSSKGARRQDGCNHAEVVAINSLAAGDRARAHTVVTTLEPCCYRNDPEEICCCKRIVRLGVEQVLIGTLDPASSVRGRGAQILQMRKVYFTMFPADLQEEAGHVNKSYIDFESELYGSGRRLHLSSGIVRDDMEFNLDYGPTRVLRYITSSSFWTQMNRVISDFRNRGIVDLEFEKFFAIRAACPGSEFASVMETGGSTIFESLASYLAIPLASSKDEIATERQLIYQRLGEWWYTNRLKHRAALRRRLLAA